MKTLHSSLFSLHSSLFSHLCHNIKVASEDDAFGATRRFNYLFMRALAPSNHYSLQRWDVALDSFTFKYTHITSPICKRWCPNS